METPLAPMALFCFSCFLVHKWTLAFQFPFIIIRPGLELLRFFFFFLSFSFFFFFLQGEEVEKDVPVHVAFNVTDLIGYSKKRN